MLRLVMSLMLMLSGPVLAQYKYIEPNQEELTDQKNKAAQLLSEAETLMTEEQFLEQLNSNRQSLNQILNQDNFNLGQLPDFVIGESRRTDRYLEKALEAQSELNTADTAINAPLIFVSFSMGDSEIEAILKEAQMINADVIIRGFIDDDFGKTYEKISEMVKDKHVGISIDPTLFERFGITSVPSFVVPLEPIQRCNEAGCPIPPFSKGAGTMTLHYFLEFLERNGNLDEKTIARTWLNKFKGG